MDFGLSQEHHIFQENISQFSEKEIKRIAEVLEEKGEFPFQLFKKIAGLGYFGLTYPPEFGGAGSDNIMLTIFYEEVARACLGVAMGIFAHESLGLYPIYKYGRDDQKNEYLVPGIAGQKIAGLAVTEPNAGSDVGSITTYARKEGDEFILNGTKMFTTNGSVADFLLVAATTDKKKGMKGICLLIVETKQLGFSVGKKLRKLGMHCSDTAEIVMQDCRVSKANLLGEEEGGFYSIMKTFTRGRIGVAAMALGVARAAYEEALKYSKERIQFGQPIGKFQVIRHMLADMAMELEISRLLMYKAAWMEDQGLECVKEASMAKLYATEMVNRFTTNAIQIFGGYGYMMEYPVQRFYRDARVMAIGEGTSQIQRDIIAKRIGL